jgi:hypothetical protein
VNIVDKDHEDGSYYQENAVLSYRRPMITACISQCAGSAENFNNGYDTKEEKDYPDYFVAFKYISD